LPAYPLTMLLVFAMTLFTSATLLMMVQPIIGKMITPLLGGTPAVWNTCMVFFQATLLAGYAYSHATTKALGARKQSLLHLGILLTPFIFFVTNYVLLGQPLAVSRTLIQSGYDNPIPKLLLLLVISVGVPFFVLSASAPLLQRWFTSTTHPAAKDPYFLYAASNIGSMLGLLSYPTLVEPSSTVRSQTWVFVGGYVLLVLLFSAGCATFLWLSPPAPVETEPESNKEKETALALAGALAASEGIQTASAKVGIARGRSKKNKRGDRTSRDGAEEMNELSLTQELTGEVTWLRRLRWVLLAAVPSSLMLGATTYMTTDIAAIAFLWVLPLALYLLSFIIVFSKIPPVVHRIFVLLLPLTVLLLVFMMLSEIKPPKISYVIAIHLVTLFVVAMVCHGELARDRPAAKHLTEFFLWMSFGGVVGGMFNGLIAPLIFNGIVEYQLAMVIACLLLPPLGLSSDSTWGYYADLSLTALCLTVGSLLIGLRLWDNVIPFTRLEHGSYYWLAAAVVLTAGLGLFAVSRVKDGRPWNGLADIARPLALTLGVVVLNLLGLGAIYLLAPNGHEGRAETGWWMYVFVLPLLLLICIALNFGAVFQLYKTRSSDKRLQAWLDVLLPFAVLLLVVGLIWGLSSSVLYLRLFQFSQLLEQRTIDIRNILTFGVPAVLCYTFVERPLRFGLSVGAVMLASAFTGIFDEVTVYQERSFFGVLKVEEDGDSHRLVHGTTLHGRQYLPLPPELAKEYPFLADRDTWPLTYYHRTGPIGSVCEAYNEPTPSIDGLGVATGSPAALWMEKFTPPRPNLGVIGLGTGTMSCYADRYQHITFYDIDPVVRKITYDSDKYFTFLKQARERGAKLDLVMGDARLTMERKQLKDDEKYHILVVDAFSSDAIPIHLITYQALLMYLEHMQEDGIICFHISNRYLNLRPVLSNLANKYRNEKGPLVGYLMEDSDDNYTGKAASSWVVLARDRKYLERLKLSDNWDERVGLKKIDADDKLSPKDWKETQPILERLGVQAYALEPRWFPLPVDPKVGEWTDDYAPLFRVFSW
jgi:hypothetical protein